MVPGETLAAALNMSGGTTFVGRFGAIHIFRQEDDGITVALSVDISRAGETELRNADVISVGSGRENRGKRYPSCFVSSGTKEICSSIYSCNREI